jgi:hypothetical protein
LKRLSEAKKQKNIRALHASERRARHRLEALHNREENQKYLIGFDDVEKVVVRKPLTFWQRLKIGQKI